MTSSDGTNYPIEPKVKVGAIATYVLGVILIAVFTAVQDGQLVNELPDWAAALIGPILPTVGAWLAAYNARHQYRASEGRTPPTP